MKNYFSTFVKFFDKYSTLITLIIVLINIILAGWTVINGDIVFNSDIARDFLLLREIAEKKLILIGPRASGLPGLFHGPLWLYFNYPAYFIGKGNPLIVGYFWIILDVIFLIISYIVAKKLFNKSVANIYVILLSAAMIFYTNNLFNPFGAMLIMPVFFFCIVRYSQTLKLKYLLVNLLALGCMIQFQMADGLPFLVLTGIYVLYLIMKNKKYSHISAFALLVLPFSTFLLFDLRHGFEQIHSIVNSFSPGSAVFHTPYVDRINNRWGSMTGNLYLTHGDYSGVINGICSLFIIYFLYNRMKKIVDKKHDLNNIIFFLLIYFYVGFYFLSVFFNGILLYHYTFPLIPLVFLMFSSMVIYQNKKVFLPLFLIVLLYNFSTGISSANTNTKAKGLSQTSWQFQLSVAQKILSDKDNGFGYFIYTPDFYGYGPKYAYAYAKSLHPEKTVYLFQKKPVTYIVVEPPPELRPELTSEYWKKSMIKIESVPENVDSLPNGFKIEKYKLKQKEIDTPVDPQATDWIHFR